MMDDDSLDIELRSPREIGERTLVLNALLKRAWLEDAVHAQSHPDAAGEAFDLRAWLRAEELWNNLTAQEQSIFSRPLGHLAENELAEIMAQAEALATLAWALHLTDHLPATAPATSAALTFDIPLPWDATAAWLSGLRLRSLATIARQREIAELLAWRASIATDPRARSLQDRAHDEAAITEVATEAVQANLLTPHEAASFSAGASPVPDREPSELTDFATFAPERLRALNWLCGFGSSWDDIPLDV